MQSLFNTNALNLPQFFADALEEAKEDLVAKKAALRTASKNTKKATRRAVERAARRAVDRAVREVKAAELRADPKFLPTRKETLYMARELFNQQVVRFISGLESDKRSVIDFYGGDRPVMVCKGGRKFNVYFEFCLLDAVYPTISGHFSDEDFDNSCYNLRSCKQFLDIIFEEGWDQTEFDD